MAGNGEWRNGGGENGGEMKRQNNVAYQ